MEMGSGGAVVDQANRMGGHTRDFGWFIERIAAVIDVLLDRPCNDGG